MTYEHLLKFSQKEAVKFNKEVEAVKLLLMELSNQDPHTFYLNLKSEVDEKFKNHFEEQLTKYLKHDIPVQHLIGHAYFYGHAFSITPSSNCACSSTRACGTLCASGMHNCNYISSHTL